MVLQAGFQCSISVSLPPDLYVPARYQHVVDVYEDGVGTPAPGPVPYCLVHVLSKTQPATPTKPHLKGGDATQSAYWAQNPRRGQTEAR